MIHSTIFDVKICYIDHFDCNNKTNNPISSNSYPSAAANKAIHCLKWGGGLQNQREHHIIVTKYEAVHPTAVSESIPHQGC